VPPGGSFLSLCPEPPALPPWLTAGDIDVYAGEYSAACFTRPLNWYRNLDRNWSLTSPWHHTRITTPALFIGGDRDFVLRGLAGPGMAERLRGPVPGLREALLLPGCGHWVQQERPAEVSEALIAFARSLG
jgi:pimeloyl-ACP methyl ester carboxylesterase